MGEPNRGHSVRKTLDQRAQGGTVLDQLTLRFERADAATWRARLAAGEVELEGATAAPGSPTRPGQVLCWHKPPWVEPDAPLSFELLLEDDHLLAVAKPSGLPTLPGGGFQEHTLLALVRAHAPEASPMHRLGRGTSGVVLFCKTREAARGVQAQWRKPGAVSKRYLALVSGSPSWETLVVNTPIGLVADPVLDGLYAATPGGKPSLSRFTVLDRSDDHSLAVVDIDTGRPHQIRIHSAWAGHPLVGDPLYGPGGGRIPGSTAVPGDLGYQLHAWRLELEHPVTGTKVSITAPPPRSLRPG